MDIFKGRLAAVEGSYFKKEQEYAAAKRRQQMIKEGKIVEADAEDGVLALHETTVPEGEVAIDMLNEVLQANSRIYSEAAVLAARQGVELIPGRPVPAHWIKQAKNRLKQIDDVDIRIRRSQNKVSQAMWGPMGAAMPYQPMGRLGLGRERWTIPEHKSRKEFYMAHARNAPSKAQQEAMTMTYNAVIRSFAYGTAICFLGLAAGGVVLYRMIAAAPGGGGAAGQAEGLVGSDHTSGSGFRALFGPSVDRARASSIPLRDWVASKSVEWRADAAERGVDSVRAWGGGVGERMRERLRVHRETGPLKDIPKVSGTTKYL